jgi:glycosyltransferase involved in cell wall biosynthesis
MVWTLVAALLLTATVIQLLYLVLLRRAGWGSNRWIKALAPNVSEAVSVVICAQDEAGNLRERLPSILNQNYAEGYFEVVVVDDGSTDDTARVLQSLSEKYPHLQVVTLPPGFHKAFPGKKGALREGVARAKNPLLLFTDADCRPASAEWLSRMVAPFGRQGIEIVVGYGGYEVTGGFLNTFIRAETVYAFSQLHDLTRAGVPYMAVGRNMAVRKTVFQNAQSDPLWNATVSGDDDMLMRIAGKAQNVAIAQHKEAYTYSPAKGEWSAYIAQKQRHLSTGKYYKTTPKWLLGAIGFSHTVYWLTLLLLGVGILTGAVDINGYLTLLLYMVLLRYVLWHLEHRAAGRKLGERRLGTFFLLFDPLFAVYTLFFAPYIFWKNKRQWT